MLEFHQCKAKKIVARTISILRLHPVPWKVNSLISMIILKSNEESLLTIELLVKIKFLALIRVLSIVAHSEDIKKLFGVSTCKWYLNHLTKSL